MEFTIESLRDKIPASVYRLLTTEDYMVLPLPEEADVDTAHAVISPPDIPTHWIPVKQKVLTEEEIKTIANCTVVASDYGLSMKFNLVDGRTSYVVCGDYHLFKEGQEWYPWDLKLIELTKYGEDATLWRVVPVTHHVEMKEFPYMSQDEYILREQIFGKILHRYYDLLIRDGKKVNIFKYLRPY